MKGGLHVLRARAVATREKLLEPDFCGHRVTKAIGPVFTLLMSPPHINNGITREVGGVDSIGAQENGLEERADRLLPHPQATIENGVVRMHVLELRQSEPS